MLMVGAKVLFNSAKMLKMGVLVVFMHDYGQQEALIDIITLVLCQSVPVAPSVAIWGCLWVGSGGRFFNPPYGPYPADLKNRHFLSMKMHINVTRKKFLLLLSQSYFAPPPTRVASRISSRI